MLTGTHLYAKSAGNQLLVKNAIKMLHVHNLVHNLVIHQNGLIYIRIQSIVTGKVDNKLPPGKDYIYLERDKNYNNDTKLIKFY